jgi:diguanylate cyclase (GGDEF)-like protein
LSRARKRRVGDPQLDIHAGSLHISVGKNPIPRYASVHLSADEEVTVMHQINEQCFRYFSEIVRTANTSYQHEKVLSLVVDRIVRTFKCQTCAIVLIDPKTEYLRIDNSYNLSLTFCNSFRRKFTTAQIGQLLWTGRPVVIEDASSIPETAREVQLEHAFRSCACVQVAADHRTLGYLYVDSLEPEAFSGMDVDILQMFADIAALAVVKSRMHDENLRLDRIDHETGLEKYGPFIERLKAERERAEQFGESLSVLLLDVDNFKSVVNTYGYETSRHLLKEMGLRVQGLLRPGDAAGRYGFDEFIVMLASTALEDAVVTATRVLREIREKPYTDRSILSTVSVGIASYPRNGDSVDAIVLTAKKALFEAQCEGRDTTHCYKTAWYTTTKEEPTTTL